jgi:DNA-binding transcriptional LysR family regulator
MQNVSSSDVYLHPDLAQTQQLLRALHRKGIHPKRLVESTSLELIAKLAAQGSGIAILPSRVAAFEGACLKAVDGAPCVRDSIACVTHTAARKVQAIKSITSAIKDSFAP